MLYVANAKRRTLAKDIVSSQAKVVDLVLEWILLAWMDGCTWTDAKDLWQVFRKDTGVTYAHPNYNTLYVTVTREGGKWQKPLGKKAAKKAKKAFSVAREAAKYTVSQLERMLSYAKNH